jgi:hypothetical protein
MGFELGRRQVLGSLLVLPAGIFLVRCGSSDSPSGTTPAAAPTSNATQTTYTSSISGGHSHTFVIDNVNFTTPPAAGLSGTTSTDSGHAHDVSITMAQLTSVGAGQSVDVTTSSSGGHTHVFTFKKV